MKNLGALGAPYKSKCFNLCNSMPTSDTYMYFHIGFGYSLIRYKSMCSNSSLIDFTLILARDVYYLLRTFCEPHPILVIQYNIPRIDNFTKVDFRYFWLEIILDYNTYEYLISDK